MTIIIAYVALQVGMLVLTLIAGGASERGEVDTSVYTFLAGVAMSIAAGFLAFGGAS